MKRILIFSSVALCAALAFSEVLDRPTGIKIGQRMTLRPYVSLSATYDSNVSGSHEGGSGKDTDDLMWTVNPGLGLDYRAETWSLLLNLYYNYHAYMRKEYSNRDNQHSYGESLRWNWSNTKGSEEGWALTLAETFSQITMADDIAIDQNKNYTADRRQLSVQGSVQRRFNEHFHSEFSASYYNLDYLNDTSALSETSALYGWQRWSGQLSGGYAPSRWLDFLAVVGYQGYKQDNVSYQGLSDQSQGYTAQLGLGSYATERISYRLLAGWSRFEYANNESASDGFVYTASGSWKISDTWNTMLMATSYYQPSERELSSKSRVDAVSWGLGKSMIRGKLTGTLDLTYRHETHEAVQNYFTSSGNDYALDVATARLGFNYTLNRFFGLFAYGEYMRSWNDESDSVSGYLDYDRWRVTVGCRLTY